MLNQQWVLTVDSTKVLSASYFCDLPNQDVFGDDHTRATQTQILCLTIHIRSHRDAL
jgi:hypothetical protein